MVNDRVMKGSVSVYSTDEDSSCEYEGVSY
jgi:hypothetical protein